MYLFRAVFCKKKSPLLTLSFICLFPAFALSQPENQFPAGGYNLVIEARPSVPYPGLDNYNVDLTASGVGPNYTVSVSRHHIIPFNVLRLFYNRVVENNALANARGFFGTYANNVRFYAQANGINCDSLGDDLITAANIAQAQGYGIVHGSGNDNAPGFDTFEQFYAWIPGNLFIGPNNRSDDPHDGFESGAGVVVGSGTFSILSRLYSNMNRYNNGDDSVLNAIVVDLTKIASHKKIYTLRAEDWEFIGGKYRLRKLEPEFNNNADIDSDYYSDKCDNEQPTYNGFIFGLFFFNK
ncbi:hypothetical protein C4K37_5105 [Pseudomonas chlororaphis subsp. piscium]|uniref:Uncharacterized protein n=2 Tax=Pseudomonas chlororaphis TaxID=587753 RepID=A0AAX3FTW6_9PSED|nr:hypothetical protein C4K37_5105 [Pseudomonas chlororaphis subsp. piscium]AZC46021.1 hypothetical protein C4K36_5118 [Pseudomonas chlororaphis subsp. piscium]VEF73933.1 Uncharacterised protein [Pseudomonas chlororaphis]